MGGGGGGGGGGLILGELEDNLEKPVSDSHIPGISSGQVWGQETGLLVGWNNQIEK